MATPFSAVECPACDYWQPSNNTHCQRCGIQLTWPLYTHMQSEQGASNSGGTSDYHQQQLRGIFDLITVLRGKCAGVYSDLLTIGPQNITPDQATELAQQYALLSASIANLQQQVSGFATVVKSVKESNKNSPDSSKSNTI